MDVLLKQDVDLGFSLNLQEATSTSGKSPTGQSAKTHPKKAAGVKKPSYTSGGASDEAEDDFQKWNALLEIKTAEV